MVVRRKPSILNSPRKDALSTVKSKLTGHIRPSVSFVFTDSYRYLGGNDLLFGINPRRVHILQIKTPGRNGESDERYEGNKTMQLIKLKDRLAKRGVRAVPGTLHHQCLEFWFGKDLPRHSLMGPSVKRRVYDVVFVAYETGVDASNKRLLSVGDRVFRDGGRRYG